ncbi:MAG: 2-polyprenyl-6-methoxyphenol hydroxylase and related FAD-dependent oxidoreductases [uncultured Paraburkholderia sp.]|nr:MAG: 2-polyprenyl-6-methoxyphenol hydroxylase and related FAD-dependent oxidoreductases [uncultured Paraburkholderia sp.]CAH2943792.1 MAG: 2-polyprenyl-6-methoxyphenol hydroxylase and related FAD-dependent oxidoreductases [uncultured Paraburkholderia sp.]
MEHRAVDVLIVGYGPVGQMLAILLGSKGYKVAVYERQKSTYPLPRAVCMGHEIYRAVMAAGSGNTLQQLSAPSPRYQWFNAKWEMLLDIDWTVESVSGGPEAHFFHQPSLEAAFDARVQTLPDVEVNRGWEAISVDADTKRPSVTFRNISDETERTVFANFVVGADGANSFVRNSVGIEWHNRGFEADWLVVDVLVNEEVHLDVPSAGQLCDPVRPTTFVPGGIFDGHEIRRWEFMRLPHETRQEIEGEANVWRLLSKWVEPSQASLVRHAVYTFKSLSACSWRRNNVFIAGDAAHLMPPFMGQGMCSGLRDAYNLSWKLDAVMNGSAREDILDTYEIERKPHANQIIDISMHLGEIVCVADAEKAAARDRAYKERTAAPPPEFPILKDGLLDRSDAGLTLAGRLGPHAKISVNGTTGRMDELLGDGFTLLLRNANASDVLSATEIAALTRLGTHIVEFSAQERPNKAHDVDGKLEAFFDCHGINALLVRPDFYIYAAAKEHARLQCRLTG